MEKFIRFYNCFTDSREGHNQYHLTSSELDTYMMIEKEKRFLTEEYIITIDTMLILNGRDINKRNKKQVKDNIQSLADKEVIEIVEDTKNYMKLNLLHENFEGFEPISLDEIEEVQKITGNNTKLFHLYVLIQTRQMGSSPATLSQSLIADVLGVTPQTANTYLNKLKELNLINVANYTKGGKKQTNKILTNKPVSKSENAINFQEDEPIRQTFKAGSKKKAEKIDLEAERKAEQQRLNNKWEAQANAF